MKKMFRSALAVAVVLIAAARSPAQDAKPVVVVSLPSYDTLVKDIAYVAGIAGQAGAEKQMTDMVDLFAGGLKGLDKSKPIGITVNTDGAGFTPVAFLPVTDLDQLLGSLQAFLPDVEDAGEGVKKVASPQGQAAFLKAQGGWAYVAQSAAALAELPDDPTKWLGGMEKQYDVGLRVHMQNLPDLYRQLAIAGLQSGVKASLKQKPDEADEDFEVRKQVVQQQIKAIVDLINDLDQFTLGWSIDAAGKKIVVEGAATAVADSETAKQFELLKDLRTDFAGFLRDDAVFSANVVSKLTQQQAAQATQTIAGFRTQLMKKLDESEDFANEDQKKVVKDLLGKLVDAMNDTFKGGRLDGGMLVMGEGPFSVALGMHVADGPALEKVLRDAIKLVSDEGAFEKVEFDVEKADDVTYHRITPMLPDDEDVAEVLGDEPKVVLGVSKSAVYMAVGTGAIESLKGIIAKSKAEASKPAKPAQISLALGKVLKFAAKKDPLNPILAGAADAMTGGDDHIRIISRVIPNGQASRIELEEGVIKAIGMGIQAAMAQFGLGGGGDF